MGIEGEQKGKRWGGGGGGSLRESFCNLSLSFEMDKAVHLLCKFSHNSFDKYKKSCKILHDAQNKNKKEKIHFKMICYLL